LRDVKEKIKSAIVAAPGNAMSIQTILKAEY
jgi:hypothetical protein